MRKAAEILARLLERHSPQAQPYSSLFGGWDQIAGDSLAEHSRVYELRQQNLIVDVDHPGWMQHLLLKKRAILAKLRRQYPQLAIRDIRVRVVQRGSLQRTEPEAAPSRGEPDKAAQASGEVEQALSEVRDADLKEKLRRLLMRSLQRRHG
jgi:predicted nucleic acid-binding Zn ribbon protein